LNRDVEILKEMLNGYYSGNKSKQELGEWANREYYNLLCGEFIMISKLEIYKFLRTIASFHIEPNDIKDEYPCSEENVRYISNSDWH